MQAKELADLALSRARELHSSEIAHRLAVQARLDLGDALVGLGQYDAAGALLEQAVLSAERDLGLCDADTASAFNSLGMWHRYRGNLAQAAAAYAQAQLILEEQGGEDLAAVLHNRASLAHLASDLAEAEQLIEHAISVRGPGGDVAGDLGVLAAVLADQGRFEEAQRTYDRSRTAMMERHGSDSPELVFLAANEAVLSHRRQRTREAASRYQSALDQSVLVLGADHPHTGEVLANMAAFHEEIGQMDLAHDAAARAVEVLFPWSSRRTPRYHSLSKCSRRWERTVVLEAGNGEVGVLGRLRLLPAPTRRLLGVHLLNTVGSGLVLPFLAVYVGRVRGAGASTGSLALVALAVGSLVANVLAGHGADKSGRARSSRRGGSSMRQETSLSSLPVPHRS